MKVLLVHESYQQPGGEDVAVDADIDLLRSHGHDVLEYRRDNHEVERYGPVRLGLTTVWSRSSYSELGGLVSREKPDIVHFHNTLPLISPAGIWAAKHARARVVQTLHNYRLACPNGLLFRDGHVCEECLHRRIPFRGVLHGCYRESRPATAAIAAMLVAHRMIGTWHRAVDVFITLTEFQTTKLVAGGLPGNRVMIRPNFVSPDPGMGTGKGGYALFVGRLVEEKGIRTLLEAWHRLPVRLPLKIVGDGPLMDEVRMTCVSTTGIECMGALPHHKVLELMHDAAFLVSPSQCYESFARVVVEAFATGLPVVAANTGGPSELVVSGVSGVLFQPGDPHGLAAAISKLTADGAGLRRMRAACRQEYLEKYTAERAYDRLMDVYERVLGAQSGETPS